MEGINIITDDKGNNKAVMLDLLVFRQKNIKAEEVLASLSDLQQLIDETALVKSKDNDWESAKAKLSGAKF